MNIASVCNACGSSASVEYMIAIENGTPTKKIAFVCNSQDCREMLFIQYLNVDIVNETLYRFKVAD